MKKLLTIVVPVYNTDLDKLKRCLKSIPDHPDVFVDIYNDCSTEYSAEAEIYDMIRSDESLGHLMKPGNGVISMRYNSGLGAVRNRSIKRLYDSEDECKFIMFLDSDDEVTITDEMINLLRGNLSSPLISFGIELIDKSGRHYEHCDKYLDQYMIPYFATSSIYNIDFLYKCSITFDESRRIFEDVMFTVDLWTMILTTSWKHSYISSKDTIYLYHLEGESLTRNDKRRRMINDLTYWVKWIQDRYKYLTDKDKLVMKPYYFNRIQYEVIKALSMEVIDHGDSWIYKSYLDMIKPYNIDKVLLVPDKE